jgi:hypothetical protein
VVRFRDGTGTTGRGIDLSSRGISLVLPIQLAPGTDSLIALETVVNGQRYSIAVRAKSVYAILSDSHFRTGFTLGPMDQATAQALTELYNQLFV